MTDLRISFSDEQVAALAARAISPETAWLAGVTSIRSDADLPDGAPGYWCEENGYVPGLLFRYVSPDGETVALQLRPDTPVVNEKTGDVMKYVFAPDSPSILHAARVREDKDGPLLLTEGTCQTIAAAHYAPDGVEVYGIAGCQSWMKRGVPTRDLAVVEGRDVFIALDADAGSNLNVYDAGVALREACIAQGAETVRFLRVPGAGKTGLDDVLAGEVEERRSKYLKRLIEIARDRPKAEKPELPAATKPKPRKADTAASPFFDGEKLKVQTLTETVLGTRPAALTRERKIALYVNGVYRIDGTGFLSALTELLGESFRTSHQGNAEAFAVGRLAATGVILPDRMTEPLLNVRNGMVDLRTGELIEHDSKYLSTVQFPIDFDPAATCPNYERWLTSMVGSQVDDLEETVALMLDPTVTPTKAVFLFGPARSGKSTMLRIIGEIAGAENTSGVTLHDLVEDKFAAANLYGKTLNVAADLPARHVDDLSVFKLMTGADLIHANRKYGAQFDFVNRALFVFSANELPTVGESSRAYAERVKPVHFPHSFAGHEDPSIETAIMGELPGILNRLIAAHRRRVERGRMLDTDPRVREQFEKASDKVRQFVDEACEVLPIETGKGGSKNATESQTTDLYRRFTEWAQDEGKQGLAKSKFRARLTNVPGVFESVSSGRSRGWNVRVLPRGEWGTARSEEDGGNDGTLSVSAYPSERASSSSGKSESVVKGQKDRPKLTKFQGRDVLAETGLIDLVAEVPAPECPDCDTEERLIPPMNLRYACPRCGAGEFEQS